MCILLYLIHGPPVFRILGLLNALQRLVALAASTSSRCEGGQQPGGGPPAEAAPASRGEHASHAVWGQLERLVAEADRHEAGGVSALLLL